MKKLVIFLLVFGVGIGLWAYLDREIVEYELGENDVLVKTGDFRFVGRSDDGQLVNTFESYKRKGEDLGSYTIEDVTKGILKSRKMQSLIAFETRFQPLKLVVGEENGEQKIYYHFIYDGVEYRHKLLPSSSHDGRVYFYFNKIHLEVMKDVKEIAYDLLSEDVKSTLLSQDYSDAKINKLDSEEIESLETNEDYLYEGALDVYKVTFEDVEGLVHVFVDYDNEAIVNSIFEEVVEEEK